PRTRAKPKFPELTSRISRFAPDQLTQATGESKLPSLAKEGWTRHQVNGPVPLTGADGVVRSTSNNWCLNQPPRSCELIVIRRYSPPCTTARRGGFVIK